MQLIRAFVFRADAFVDQQAFGGVTWGQVLLVVFAVTMVLLIWGFLTASSRKPEPRAASVVALCVNCGWRGRTSKHELTCPNCGEELEVQ